jgi:hypothetical protein
MIQDFDFKNLVVGSSTMMKVNLTIKKEINIKTMK